MKIDLHVHSKYSVRPSQWVLQKLGCHECYTEPEALYRLAKQQGLTKVTITDHNTLNGVLEIAHLPDTFLSEEVTAYFPEDGCKVHVLVYHLTVAQHQEIQKLRENIVDLVHYLRQEGLPHVLAHPLWSVNGRLTASHFERLLLLFRTFEINGSRDRLLSDCLQIILSHLTPELLAELADKHRLTPPYPDPWRKSLSGGSDDHSALTIGRLYTEVPHATTLEEFFAGLEQQQARVLGQASTPLTLAHNIYSIAYQFYQQKFNLEPEDDRDPILRLLSRALLAAEPARPKFFAKWPFFGSRKSAAARPSRGTSSWLTLVREELLRFIRQDEQLTSRLERLRPGGQNLDEEWFAGLSHWSGLILRQFTDRLGKSLAGANLFDGLYGLTALGLTYLVLAPYPAAYASFARDRHFCRQMLQHFGLAEREQQAADFKVAHFTDTFYEINGVALTLRRQAEWAARRQKPYVVITCDADGQIAGPRVKNFTPLGVWELPEYREQKLFHPPFLEILRYCYDENFTQIHAATPGPLGLVALAVGRLLQIPIVGTYHTALPQYAQYLTEDTAIEEFMWRYVLWFYDQLDLILVPSQSTKDELSKRGISPEKIRLYPRGVDIHRFHPAKRNGWLQERHGLPDGPKLLYVGRVSKEKNLQFLIRILQQLWACYPELYFIVVGDGPYLEEMQQSLAGRPCLFTGYLTGEDLSAVYASSDLFVFPSTTDTFGNVVLEAQASGLPVLVADQGGPRENIIPGETGLVLPAQDEEAWITAITDLLAAPERRRRMGLAARRAMEERSFDQALEAAWQLFRQLETTGS